MWNFSFQPCGKWFVFNEVTGETRIRDLHSQRDAIHFLVANKLLSL